MNLENQSMCPQQSYYKASISHKNWFSPPQEFSTKIPQLWPVVVSVDSKPEHQIDSKLKLMAHRNYLPTTATIYKNLLNKKILSIIVILSKNFLNTFIKIAILGKLYQYSICYAKLEQHWTKCLCVHNSSIIQRDGEQHFLFNKPLLIVGIAVK